MLNFFFLVTVMVFSVSCSNLWFNRTHYKEMDRRPENFFSPGNDFPVSQGDSGHSTISKDELARRTPSSEKELFEKKYEQSVMEELKYLEEKLSEKEVLEYEQVVKHVETNSAKIYYLKLTKEERAEYVQSLGSNQFMRKRTTQYIESPISQLRRAFFRVDNDINIGMTKKQVRNSWGSPTSIDVAGNPMEENERWYFAIGNRIKRVYFENGRVEGWMLD